MSLNLSHDKIISIFGRRGFVDGAVWVVDEEKQPRTFMQIPPSPVGHRLAGFVMKTIPRTCTTVDEVTVTPDVAVRLFLEGIITTQHVREAETRNGSIIFRDVAIYLGSRVFEIDIVVNPVSY